MQKKADIGLLLFAGVLAAVTGFVFRSSQLMEEETNQKLTALTTASAMLNDLQLVKMDVQRMLYDAEIDSLKDVELLAAQDESADTKNVKEQSMDVSKTMNDAKEDSENVLDYETLTAEVDEGTADAVTVEEDGFWDQMEETGQENAQIMDDPSETSMDSMVEQPLSADVFSHVVTVYPYNPEFVNPMTSQFVQEIQEGNQKFYYVGQDSDAEKSLSEVVSYFCSRSDQIYFYEGQDAGGRYLEITAKDWPGLYASVASSVSGWESYMEDVDSACYTLNLKASDQDLVEQINQYICDRFDYVITDKGMPDFVTTNQGQCWHYAKYFADMCKAVGIPAWIVHSDVHAWVNVRVDGQTYKFDPTWNDASGDETGDYSAYSWLLLE